MPKLPIAIYYEQPNWFKPLFAELDRRGTPYVQSSSRPTTSTIPPTIILKKNTRSSSIA